MSETALIVEVSEAEEAVHEWRARHDSVAARGVPAHVTVLFPFVAPSFRAQPGFGRNPINRSATSLVSCGGLSPTIRRTAAASPIPNPTSR